MLRHLLRQSEPAPAGGGGGAGAAGVADAGGGGAAGVADGGAGAAGAAGGGGGGAAGVAGGGVGADGAAAGRLPSGRVVLLPAGRACAFGGAAAIGRRAAGRGDAWWQWLASVAPVLPRVVGGGRP